MRGGPYEPVLTPPATRAIRFKLPESVAAAVVEFLTGALIENPQRADKQLRGELACIYSARRGTYRVLYRINEVQHEGSSSASTTARTSTAPDALHEVGRPPDRRCCATPTAPPPRH